jgi:hydrogenase maturation protein HypF
MSQTLRSDQASTLSARKFVISGRVQGLGVRPSIARLAATLRLTGTVANTGDGVEVVVEGTTERLELFRNCLLAGCLPDEAVVDNVVCLAAAPGGHVDFRIEECLAPGAVATEVPRDAAVCRDCLDEVAADDDRRFGYPFASCTRCGPRFSIIERMPYERLLTGMRNFPLCEKCSREHECPGDRRYHAQTNCCPTCGPQIWCATSSRAFAAHANDAIQLVTTTILAGKIVALRGVGGYQLLCDATNEQAVGRLRDRKQRPSKPLALMVESVAAAGELAIVGSPERNLLASAANPIVLLAARSDSPIAGGVHPGLNDIGLMLPTSPLHFLLCRRVGRPLVVTSGNREGSPLAVEVEQAEQELADVADLWLHHNRPILRPIDDSVVRLIAGRPVTIRNARGLAPLPLPLSVERPILAVGGHQKSAIAISNGKRSILGPHVGDLDGIANQERFDEQLKDLCELYGKPPKCIVDDLHPTYSSTRWAQRQGLPTIAVQHHHAHIAAGMVEHGWIDRDVIGVAFDGTGYGTDGTIWGGEFLLSTATTFRRVGHIRPFALPGGEASIREPWRVAVALVADAIGEETARSLWPERSRSEIDLMLSIRNNRRFSPVTTSAGRLFDAVAVLAIGLKEVDYEGQAAMELEATCDAEADGRYQIAVQDFATLELDWRPMICRLVAERHTTSPGAMAIRFHRALASTVVDVVRRFTPLPVVLGGGTFQNRVLTQLIADEMQSSEQQLGLPGDIPPNDGGLAAGQLAIAAALQRNGWN